MFGFQIQVDSYSDVLPVMEVVEKAVPAGLNTSSDGNSFSFYDAFNRKIIPNKLSLVRQYKRIAYACANLNANTVTDTPLRLYLKTGPKDTKSILKSGTHTKPITHKKIDELSSLSYLNKTLRSFIDVEEVVDHPVLDLLEKGNDSIHLNGFRLAELTQLFQEMTGEAYWLIETDDLFGLPTNIWILPSHYITPIVKNLGSATIVDHYEYNPPGVSEPIIYSTDEIIPYLMPSLLNPYVEGMSPLAAAFESNEVNNKYISHQDSLLENEGRPDGLLVPDKDSAIGPDEARRLERQYRLKFGRGRDGGIWAMSDNMSLIPLGWPPKDLAKLEIHKASKNEVSNAFQVPYALISDSSHNREQLEAAKEQHAKYGIKPRVSRDACVKNDQLLRRYDPTGRLFLAYDDPVPQNKEEKLQENIQLLMGGARTPNEVRKNYGDPPMAGGDKLVPINVSPELAREKKANSGTDGRKGKGKKK